MDHPSQLYVLPVPASWAVLVYGDSRIADDSLVPLPLTAAVGYDEAVTFVRGTPIGAAARFVDGWATVAELVRCEPQLARRAGWLFAGALAARS